MSGEDLTLLTRLDAVAEAVISLHTVLSSQESLEEAFWEVARNAVNAVSAADAVSITVLGDTSPRTVACTDEFVLALDAQQYRSGGGPCLEAARASSPVRVAMDAAQQQWPEFAAAAHAVGVHATLSIPLVIAAKAGDGCQELAGSLNAYSRSSAAYDAVDEKLLSLYTDVASQAVANARRWQQLVDTVAQLEEALVSRSDIDQAKGALRTLNGGSAEEAFGVLAERSQRENVKVRDLARKVMDELSRGLPSR